ncbi:MAG TPA: TcmI family type II polyketide cyclase [Trebonia sp.]|jgi:hypothetical protein|nr:TcmI family type II polyketide cyclase [Trebonia sp.]
MHTTVNLSRIGPFSPAEAGRLFGEFDESGMSRHLGVRRRQLFTFNDLLIHVQDFDHEPGEGTVFQPGTAYSPFDAHATRFYTWAGRPAATTPAVTSTALYSTVIVGRMDEARTAEVCQVFSELDSTDFPGKMGTRRRQLYLCRDVYLHVQHFTQPSGTELIDQAWLEADPRFIKACQELMAIIPPYEPRAWTVPTDSVATRFYQWEEGQ